jgi:hypothetical protein
MEERRKADDAFMEKFFKLESAVQRLTEHERDDRPKYERWHKETLDALAEMGKMRLELSNGRLTALETRPILVQLTEKEIKAFFDEWGETLAGRLSFRFILSVAGTLGVVLTAIVTAAIIAYIKLK